MMPHPNAWGSAPPADLDDRGDGRTDASETRMTHPASSRYFMSGNPPRSDDTWSVEWYDEEGDPVLVLIAGGEV